MTVVKRSALAMLGLVAVLVALAPAIAAPGDTVADRVFGQAGSFTSKLCNIVGEGNPPTAGSLCSPRGVAVDSGGNLYVADSSNHRVLEYDSPVTTDTVADRVFGQGGSFTSNSCNLGGISASSLCLPSDVTVDSAGNLYVADRGNNRVLQYDSPLTTDTVADRVFGQGGSFTSGSCNLGGVSASSLCGAQGLAVDSAGNLYLADGDNHRVLEYDSPLTTDTVADRVFGQGGSFTSKLCNIVGEGNPPTAGSLCEPDGLAVDATGNFYVADRNNRRVLEYDSPLTTDTVADRVFGQGGSFTSNSCNLGGISASSLCLPYDVTVDGARNLYVADGENHRLLEYNSPLTTDTVADRVFGQGGSFTSESCNLGGVSASSVCDPNGVAVDAARNVYLAEYNGNHRVLEYDSPLMMAVGGIAELPDVSESSGPNYAVLATLATVLIVVLSAGAWNARRRWLRQRP